jgi:hypothetical protein
MKKSRTGLQETADFFIHGKKDIKQNLLYSRKMEMIPIPPLKSENGSKYSQSANEGKIPF